MLAADDREAAQNLTQQFVQQQLNPRVATDLVVATLPRLPAAMPARFRNAHVPLVAGPTHLQAEQVSNSLAAFLTAAGVGPGAEKLGIKPVRAFVIHYFGKFTYRGDKKQG